MLQGLIFVLGFAFLTFITRFLTSKSRGISINEVKKEEDNNYYKAGLKFYNKISRNKTTMNDYMQSRSKRIIGGIFTGCLIPILVLIVALLGFGIIQWLLDF